MKLFKNLFKKTEAKPEPLNFNLPELEDWLKGKIDSETKGICEQAREIPDNLAEVKRKVYEELDQLEKAELNPEMVKRPRDLISTARKYYVTGLRHHIEGFGPLSPSGYSGFNELSKSLVSCLSNISVLDSKHAKLVMYSFTHQMRSLRRELNGLISNSNKLQKCLDSGGKRVKLLNEISSELSGLKEKSELLVNMKTEKSSLEGKLKGLGEEKSGIETEREGLKKGEEYAKLSGSESRITEHESRIGEIDAKFFNGLSPLRRVMKKYKRYAEVMEPGSKSLLDYLSICIDSPREAAVSSANSLDNLLEDISEKIGEKKIEIDSKEREKVLAKIKNFLGQKPNSLREERSNLLDSLNSAKSELANSSILKHSKKLNEKSAEIERSISEAKKKLKELAGIIEKTEQDSKSSKENLEVKLGELDGNKVSLVV